MRIFVATRALVAPEPLSERLELLAMAEVHAVTLPGGELDAAAAGLVRHGMAVWLDGVPAAPMALNLAAGDEDLRRRMVARVRDFLPRAGAAGAIALTLPPGYALEETRQGALPSAAIAPERARDQLLRSLDALAPDAERAGVPLWLSHGDGQDAAALGAAPELLAGVCRTLQIPWLGVVLDWGHLERLTRREPGARSRWPAVLGGELRALRLSTAERRPLPADAAFDEALAEHPGWQALPWSLELRSARLGELLDARDALARRRRKLAGPAR